MFDKQKIDLSAFYHAMQSNDIQVIKAILDNNEEYIMYKNQLGESLIHIAVKDNFKELIQYLIQKGLDINNVDYSNRTALHLAVATRNEHMIKYLLECKASTNLKDHYGKSPFHMTVQLGNIKLVELFLQNGANVLDFISDTHETAFHIALKNEDEETFILLLKYSKNNINVSDVYGETLLHILARQKNKHLVKLLLENGADLEMINKDNETALHFAIHNRNYDISKLFIEYGANVNAKNKYGESPLHLAIRYKDLKLVNLLLTNNANVNERTNCNDTMLHIAINYYNENIVNLLLEYGIDVKCRNLCNLSPFHLAIKNKCISAARILLNNGVNINSAAFGRFTSNMHKEDSENQIFTPLHTAIVQKDVNAVKFLLENGAKFDSNQNYEMFLAVETGCVEIVEQLIKYGANVNAVNAKGQSLLYTAMKIRNKEEVQTLLHYGADSRHINETNCENETALHLAVKAKDEKFVRFLLSIGVDINICNFNDSTALCFAYGNASIANLLIMNIALLKVNNFFVCQRNEITINTVEEFNLYFSKCCNELQEIKNKKCHIIPLIYFLTKDVFTIAKFVRKKAVIAHFKAIVNYNAYPIYFEKLTENLEKGIDRWNLLTEAKSLLCSTPYFEPLYDVLDKIIDNFSNEELNNFIKNSKKVEYDKIFLRF